jgi:hypothetical protein
MPSALGPQKVCCTLMERSRSWFRADTVDFDTGLAYATHPGNLRLELADCAPPPPELAGSGS